MSPPTVAVIVPVLGRPWRVVPLMASVAAATPEPHRLLFVVSDDDRAELDALDQAGADHLVVDAGRGSYACKINAGAAVTDEEWVMAAADDVAFRAGWFTRALAWATDSVGVVGTNDLCNPRVMTGEHSTHTLFRRSYIAEHGTVDQPGLVLHEGYPHDFVDDEAIATARARGMYVHAFDAIVEHLHPMVGKAADDATYRLGREASGTGRRVFATRRHLWANLAGPAPPATTAPPARATVVTATYGGYDTALHAPAGQDMAVDWVCLTDRPDLVTAPAPWRVVAAPARFDDPVLAAKVHKATPTVDTTDVVWVDATMEITSPSFVADALAARRHGVAVFDHPRRRCIYTEADASLGAEGQDGKYAGQPLMAQVAAYRAEGHPVDGGLYACGVVAWDLADPGARALGEAWLAECARWSWQDQLSFPVVCRRAGITPGVFPLGQIETSNRRFLANRWLRIWPHLTPAFPAAPAPATAGVATVSVLIPYSPNGCAHREAAYRYVTAWYAQHHPAWQVVAGGPTGGTWSKGEALAELAGRADHDIWVIADADSVVPADTLTAAVAWVAAGHSRWAMPHQTVYRLSEAHTARVLAGADPKPRDTVRDPYPGVVGGGVTVVTRQAWHTVGGVDGRFVGWGGEDLAFGWALRTLCGPPGAAKGPLWHLWHPPETQGARRRGNAQSEALAGRYRDALDHPHAMAALVAEHRPAPVPA